MRPFPILSVLICLTGCWKPEPYREPARTPPEPPLLTHDPQAAFNPHDIASTDHRDIGKGKQHCVTLFLADYKVEPVP